MEAFQFGKPAPVDRWILDPMRRFISKSSTGGILLFSAAVVAVVLTNSPLAAAYEHFWELEFKIGFGDHALSKPLHHWINDGLMAIFFFVVGLELKREIMGGALSTLKGAMMPVAAAFGGMVVPALIYWLINPSGPASSGWGIPMATDIAFALGILHLLGDRVPLTMKIFLTALAIADDLGAVLVIAIFYTSQIDLASLAQAGIYLSILIAANRLGVRSTFFYALVGAGGVWLAFLMSGVHATIAAVLIAFTIPAKVKIDEASYTRRLEGLLKRYKDEEPNNNPLVTTEQLHIIEEIRTCSKLALTPLQRLEHALHPIVTFIIMPVFALANAGVSLEGNFLESLVSPVSMGVILGLIVGKFIGVFAASYLMLRSGLGKLPEDLNLKHLAAMSVVAGIGFTMSLFVTELAFSDSETIGQARFGILTASILAAIAGYLTVRSVCKPAPSSMMENDVSSSGS
jgi:Na+:H+ antiporter, NhaA family